MLGCVQNKERISLYADGYLSGQDKSDLEDHLTECPDCAKNLAETMLLKEELSEMPLLELPDGLHEQMIMACKKSQKAEQQSIVSAIKKRMFPSASYKVFARMVAGAAVTLIAVSMVAVGIDALFGHAKQFDEYNAGIEIQARFEGQSTDDVQERIEMQGVAEATMAKEILAYTDLSSEFIKNCSVYIEVENTDEIISLIDNLPGYTEDRTQGIKHYDGIKYADVTKRVTSGDFDYVLNALNVVGTAVNSHVSQTRITDSFDVSGVQARLTAKQAEYERLLSMLSATETVSDMILVNNRLSKVITEIESCKGQINYWERQSKYATMYISVSQKRDIDIKQKTFSERIDEAFTRSVNNTVQFSEFVLTFIAAALPPLLLISAIALAIFVAAIGKR